MGMSFGIGPALEWPQAIAWDDANARLLIGDSQLDALLALDLATGTRSLIADVSHGTGPALDAVTALALDGARSRALVLERSELIAVDLASGDRTPLASVGDNVIYPGAMAVDAAGDRALVARVHYTPGGEDDLDAGDLLAVNLSDNTQTFVSSSTMGDGPELSGGERPARSDRSDDRRPSHSRGQ